MTVDERGLGDAFAALDRDGYCVIEGVLDTDEVGRLRDALAELAGEERAAGVADVGVDGPNNQRVWALTHKNGLIRGLLEHPLLWTFMNRVLGSGFLLSSLTANIAGPAGPAMFLHSDQDYIPPPWPPSPLVANLLWMLDDFTEDNGATRVVPRSHLRDGTAIARTNSGPTVAITGSAGSALCFDGRLLHQTGENRTADQYRHGILTYCCKPWIRQQENSSLSIPEWLWPELSPDVRQLVGLNLYLGLGMIDGPTQRGFRFHD